MNMLARKHKPIKAHFKSRPEVRDCARFAASDLTAEVRRARRTMRDRGWSYRRAADALKVHHMHLTHVLTGRRKSKQLCARILNLPVAKGGRP